ncbi:MAG: ABC transporter substrate-binding protein, partial [Desulfobacterales bacterium]|nr:ABC transporter substrate-binding protein [Desulfobacterales bacterium]
MKRNRTILAVILALLLLSGGAWAQETIKIGVVGPRTGPAAATGAAFDEGIKLAVEYVNSKGG